MTKMPRALAILGKLLNTFYFNLNHLLANHEEMKNTP